jgi:hypothetical protein
MKTLREIVSKPAAARIPTPLVAAVSLMLAIAPAHAQNDELPPADEIVADQPLDESLEPIGEEEIVEEPAIDPATVDNSGDELPPEDIAAEPSDAPQTPDILVDPGVAAEGAEELPPPDDQAVTDQEQLPAPDEAQTAVDGENDLLPAEDGQAVSGDELLPAPDEAQTATDGENDLLPAEDGQAVSGDELLPAPDEAQTAIDGENDLLPAEEGQAVSGDELLPAPDEAQTAIDGENDLLPADSDEAEPELETVMIDPNQPTPAAVLPQGVVRIIIQNRSPAPLDLFMDAKNGSDPVWVMTLNPGFQVTQPSNTGQAWLLAQQDQWKGGFEAGQEPVQRLRFDGGPL